MVNAINNKGVKIYIAAADAIGTALSDEYEAYIESIDASGGEKSFDSIATFGGDIPNEGPQEAYEVSFDLILALDTNVTKWLDFLDNGTSHVLAVQGGSAAKGGFFWTAWNNAICTGYTKAFSADDVWKGTITFQLTAFTETGDKNIQEGFHVTDEVTDATNGLIAW